MATPAKAQAEQNADKVWKVTTAGAILGAIGGFVLACIDRTDSTTLFIAYSFLVVPAMAIIGGLIAANCVPVHD
jgi:uncharacterized membrane protein